MKIKQMRFREFILFISFFLPTILWGQEIEKTEQMDISEDSLGVSPVLLSKESDSLNGYLNDTIFGILDTAEINLYPFIHLEKNHYQFFTKESPTFERLFFEIQQMIQTKKGKVNIYHLGGSHVQADIYSNVMREHLLNYWDELEGERGWVFPYKIAGTNNPWNYGFTSKNEWKGYRSVVTRPDSVEYGLLGMAIATRDTLANLHFDYKGDGHKPPIDHIRIYHNKGVLPYEIYFDSLTPVKSQFSDDSLGFTDVYFEKEHLSFEVFFEKIADSLFLEMVDGDSSYSQTLFIYGMQLMNNRPGFSYSSVGVNGAGLYTYRDNKNFLEQLSQSPPDFMIFSVGTNDANVPADKFVPEEFEENLETIMKKVLTANPNCAILLTIPNDSYYKRKTLNKNLEIVRDINNKLAEKYQVPVWDLYGIMGGLGSSQTWQRNKLMKNDLVHFSIQGYQLKGDMFFEAFLKWIEQMELKPRKTLLKEK